MSRTTDARQAIQDLLKSSDHDTVIQYDGISYRVAPSGDKREGFYEILRRVDAYNMLSEAASMLPSSESDLSKDETLVWWAAEVVKRDSEFWLRSARYNESLATTATDL